MLSVISVEVAIDCVFVIPLRAYGLSRLNGGAFGRLRVIYLRLVGLYPRIMKVLVTDLQVVKKGPVVRLHTVVL